MRKKNRGRPRIKYDNFRVIFSPKSFLKIRQFNILAKDNEWLCFLLKNEQKCNGNIVYIDDIYFPSQIIASANCSLRAEDFTKEISNLIKTKEGQDSLERFCGWMHSHNSMGAFFSGTDDETNERMKRYMPTSKVFISLVISNDFKFDGKAIIRLKNKEHIIDNVVVDFDFGNIKTISRECNRLWKKRIEEDVTPVRYTHYESDVKRIPKKYKRVLTSKLVKKVINASEQVIYAKNLRWSLYKFLNKYRGRLRKAQRKTIKYLFRAMFFNKFTDEEALENFAKDYKKPKIKKIISKGKYRKDFIEKSDKDQLKAIRSFKKSFRTWDTGIQEGFPEEEGEIWKKKNKNYKEVKEFVYDDRQRLSKIIYWDGEIAYLDKKGKVCMRCFGYGY